MKKRNIGEEILQGLKDIEQWQQNKIKLKTTEIKMPKARDVALIRDHLGLTQQAFASFMGVSIGTLRNWEQGRREPHGAARSLLLIAEKVPEAFRKAFDLASANKRAA